EHACGVVALECDDPGDAGYWARVAAARERSAAGFALVFFSSARFAPDVVTGALAATCPGLRYAACSTAGEITRSGISEGNLIVILFPADRFRIAAHRIRDIRRAGMERIVAQVGEAKRQFVGPAAARSAHT
ncbi:hypothetical protein HKX42_12090, partial [Salinisphaera sp. USBA-960]|nr:hypothetical protein [Salifodinibacter halophilus]